MIYNDYFLVDYKYYKQASAPDKSIKKYLDELCVYNRINTLTSIYKANHGWLGASLSITEILTNIYFDIVNVNFQSKKNSHDFVLLSKGHAAVMQYACLAGKGIIPVESLLCYKTENGLQAHTDINTAGIEINSGSLGQALSKACGFAFANKDSKIFVILGDGELQEGQNFEALMTIKHYNLINVIPIIDKNNIQSDSNVKDIKKINNLNMLLNGFGFDILEITGNDNAQVNKTLKKMYRQKKCSVMIANTSKGAGVSFMQADNSKRRAYSWHSAIPDKKMYINALEELSALIGQHKLKIKLEKFIVSHKKNNFVIENILTDNNKINYSTGAYFSKKIVDFAGQNKDIYCLDADLEKSCKLTEFAMKFPESFVEMGIAEQDMVSFAGGLALNGKLPVVNTYANFYRRAFEQIYVNATEKTKIIYAGHYSGLCYTTDGKTHQATGDIAMFRSIPNMFVFYPAFNDEIPQILDWYLKNNHNAPVYFKLHRTPVKYFSAIPQKINFSFGCGIKVIDNSADVCVLTSGPQLTEYSNIAAEHLKSKYKINIDVFSVSTLKFLDAKFTAQLLNDYNKIIIIEENIDAGGLFDEFCKSASSLKKNNFLKKIYYKAVDDFTFSTLDSSGLYKHFKLDTAGIITFIKKIYNEKI